MMRQNSIFNKIINFLHKYKIIFNYYFLSIIFLLLLTMILIILIGNNVLKHESKVLKKEFINKNKRMVMDLSQSIESHLENLDTLSIIDLIDRVSKQDEIVNAYVVNNEGEVIAHTEKSEVLKKYKDGFINKKYLNIFIKNLKNVWQRETDYKGKPTLVLSKPIILQFARETAITELEQGSYDSDEMTLESFMSNEEDSLSTNKNSQESQGKSESDNFYIAGAFHASFSMEKLQELQKFSKQQVRIYYFIAYALAALLGYLIGKFLENSLHKANSTLEAFNKDIKVDEISMDNRFDSFKKLFLNINQFVSQHKTQFEKSGEEIKEFHEVYGYLISHLCDHLKSGVIITDPNLKVEYINDSAKTLLNKKEVVSRNLNDVLEQYISIADEVNKMVKNHQQDIRTIEIDKKTFSIILLYVHQQLKRLIIFISLNGKVNMEASMIQGSETQKEDQLKPSEKDTNNKEKISSRLKNL